MKKLNRRNFIGATAMLSVGTVAASAMPTTTATTMKKNYPIVHHVFFWMKNPDSKTDRDQLIAGLKTLSKIKEIKGLHVGVVADTEKRDVVDQSWGVSELMFFDDLVGQKSYQDHPIHQEFIKNCSHLWDKVVVYDIVEA
ncbi:hypothetical protein IWX76_002302 [Pedobacter sp. CAN_A7]|uniref:Dabb family protein n=1 Tax=Pedobacter sp. CAN_A7 TaxID=2787722 RepID=UPI0018CA2117